MCIRDSPYFLSHWDNFGFDGPDVEPYIVHNYVSRIDSTDYQKSQDYNEEYPVYTCLLYTSDAADERSSVDLGGRRIIKKKKNTHTRWRRL